MGVVMNLIECYCPSFENFEKRPIIDAVPMPKEIVEWYDCPRRSIRVFRCTDVPKIETIHKLYGLGEFIQL